jgi:Stage II sporulation protein E (SpoIIE)
MGRTRPRARRGSRSLAAFALIATSLAFVSSAASGKRPDALPEPAGSPVSTASPGHEHGYEHEHGHGHGNGDGPKHDAAPEVPAPDPVPELPAATPGSGARPHGNGHGHGRGHDGGHGHGHGNGGETTTAPVQEPAKQSTPVTSPTSTGVNSGDSQPVAVSPPQPPAATPAPAKPPKTATTGGSRTRGTARARRRDRAGHRRSAGSPTAPRPGRRGTAGRAFTGPAPVFGATEPGAPAHDRGARPHTAARADRDRVGSSPIVRTLEHVVEVIPVAVKAIVLVLGLLLLLASLSWFLHARTARYLRRQREMLLEEVGVLQGALLPSVPAELSRLQTSVAYRPAEGLAAGGDFYDAFALDGGRVGIVVGDVTGHGRDALMHTALLRYTLRAYLEADLEPRAALQVAGRALDRGFETLATVVLAVYDPRARVLRYACAGHPPPVFLGEADHVPVTVASSPPIGAGLPTGLRQTTVCLPAGSAVCFFTDGLIEARRGEHLIGRLGLREIIRGLGPGATAAQVLERVAAEADRVDDDMAACMFRVVDGPAEATSPRVEEIEVRRGEPLDTTLGRFLAACGVEPACIPDVIVSTARSMRLHRGAVVQVSLRAEGTDVQVGPANVESFASAETRRDPTVFAAR